MSEWQETVQNEGEGMTSNILAILSVLKLDRRGVANGGTIR